MVTFPTSGDVSEWVFRLENASIEMVQKLFVTSNLRAVTIIGGYLILRPHLQRLLGSTSASEHDESFAASSTEAMVPKTSPNDRSAGQGAGDKCACVGEAGRSECSEGHENN